MENRIARALIGLLLVICVGLTLSVVYPFTTSEPHAANPPGEQFTARTADAYSAAGSVVVDGEVKLAFEGVVTPDGAWYRKVVEEHVTSEEYRPTANGTVYERLTVADRTRAERIRDAIVADEDRALVRETRDGDDVTFVVEEDAIGDTDPISGTASVIVRSLSVAGYEPDGTGSSAVIVYEPQSGWYEGIQAYRIMDASGEVRVDAGTHAVTSANVSWEVTTPAGTYAEYLLARLTSDAPTTYRITFEFDRDDHGLERPPWVDEADDG